jgi:hypothetical protein
LIEPIKDAYDFFYRNIRPITFLTLVIDTPYILVANIYNFTDPDPSSSSWATLIFLAASLVVNSLAMGAQAVLYSKIINGEVINLKECILKSRAHLLKLIIASLIFAVITIIGFFAFIIPGIIIAVRCSLFGFLIINEGYDPISSLKRSARLTKEYALQMAGPLILFSLFIGIAQLSIIYTLKKIGLDNFFFTSLFDILLSIISWINLVLMFRFYCLLKPI